MDKNTYTLLENYMISCMEDSAHDKEHIYRVLYTALEIAAKEEDVDYDILITSCLLHDIGRKEQNENPKLCHAVVGGEKAYKFLTEQGFDSEFAGKVRDCITTHRFRKGNPPESLEAKILFDADKLDVTGAVGIARTLVYKGQFADPLYLMKPDGSVSDGTGDEQSSFFQEYKFKLENLYGRFLTARGAEMAAERQQAAVDFYNNLYREVSEPYIKGSNSLNDILK